MESTAEQRVNSLESNPRLGCGRPGCACGLPISERFVLWALRQWQHDRALPAEGSVLHQGFKTAGVLEALPDFAIAMDAFLFYAKGGFAFANRKDSISAPALGASASDSQTHTGYTIGGGVEYLFTPNWSAKGEYMYTSLGSKQYNFGGGDVFDSGSVDFHTIKVGVNYHFR